MTMLLRRLGWQVGETRIPLRQYTVRVGTHLQLRTGTEARATAHSRFLREAMGIPEATPLTPLQGTIVGTMLRRVWGTVRWENAHKEALWRLAVDGIPLLGNSHMRGAPVRPCGCGGYAAGSAGGASPRMHHFWRCEVAQAVVGQLEGTLKAPG